MDRKATPSNNYRRRDSYETPDRNRQRQVRRSRTRSRSPYHSSSQRNTFRNPRERRTSRSPHFERQYQIDKETPTRKSLFTENGRTKNNLDKNIVKKSMHLGSETIFKIDRDTEILVNPNKSSPTRTVSSPRMVTTRPKEGKVLSSSGPDRHTYDSRKDHREYTGRRNDYNRRLSDINPSPSRRERDYSTRDSYDCRNGSRGETGRNYKNDNDRPERPRNDRRDHRQRERSHDDDSRTDSSSSRERDHTDNRRDSFNGRCRSEEKPRNSDRSGTYDKCTEEIHSNDKNDANEEQPEREENNVVLAPKVPVYHVIFPIPLHHFIPSRPPPRRFYPPPQPPRRFYPLPPPPRIFYPPPPPPRGFYRPPY